MFGQQQQSAQAAQAAQAAAAAAAATANQQVQQSFPQVQQVGLQVLQPQVSYYQAPQYSLPLGASQAQAQAIQQAQAAQAAQAQAAQVQAAQAQAAQAYRAQYATAPQYVVPYYPQVYMPYYQAQQVPASPAQSQQQSLAAYQQAAAQQAAAQQAAAQQAAVQQAQAQQVHLQTVQTIPPASATSSPLIETAGTGSGTGGVTRKPKNPVAAMQSAGPASSAQAAKKLARPNAPRQKVSAFVAKLYSMLEDPKLSHLIWWSRLSQNDDATFAILPGSEFANSLTFYFKHGNVASFVRQLHMYGFHKVCDSTTAAAGDRPADAASGDASGTDSAGNQGSQGTRAVWEFRHSTARFRKGDRGSLSFIRRRSTSSRSKKSQPDDHEDSSAATYGEQSRITSDTKAFNSCAAVNNVATARHQHHFANALPQGFSFHTARPRYPSLILDPYAAAPAPLAQASPAQQQQQQQQHLTLSRQTELHDISEDPLPPRSAGTAAGTIGAVSVGAAAWQPRSASSPSIRRDRPPTFTHSPAFKLRNYSAASSTGSMGDIFSGHNSISSVSTGHGDPAEYPTSDPFGPKPKALMQSLPPSTAAPVLPPISASRSEIASTGLPKQKAPAEPKQETKTSSGTSSAKSTSPSRRVTLSDLVC